MAAIILHLSAWKTINMLFYLFQLKKIPSRKKWDFNFWDKLLLEIIIKSSYFS